jgi:hypothetical protein
LDHPRFSADFSRYRAIAGARAGSLRALPPDMRGTAPASGDTPQLQGLTACAMLQGTTF